MRRVIGLATLMLAFWAAPAGATTAHTIAFDFSFYSPNDVTWLDGDTVTFSGDFGSHPLRWEDASLEGTATPDFSAKPAGTYRFFCQFHGGPGGSGMSGIVRKPDGTPPATPALGFSPQAPQTGQTVTFTGTAGSVFYEWDLDGDGATFERRTTSASTSISYASEGARTVRLRVMEADGDFSAPAEQSVTVTKAPATSPPPAGGVTATPPPTSDPGGTTPAGGTDTVKPAVSLLSTALRASKGKAKLRFRSNETGKATTTLKVKGKLVGSGSLTIARAGAQSLTITLNKRGRGLLRNGRLKAALRLEVRDRAGNLRVRSGSLAVRK